MDEARKEQEMKLSDQFVVHDTGSEQIMVPVGSAAFSGMVRSNRTAAFIVDCLREETTEDGIVGKLLAKYDVSEEIARKDVRAILGKLRSVGALVE
jgi:hypothetical protein